jgi:hypothetical protein
MVTVPARCELIIFGAPADFYLRADGSPAAVPTGDITDGTGSMYAPSVLRFTPGDTFSLVAPTAVSVTMRCHEIPGE